MWRADANWFTDEIGCAVRSGWMGDSRSVMLTGSSPFSNTDVVTMHLPAPDLPAFTQPDGLITAVAQDAVTGRVLMVAHMNQEAWQETLATGRAVYYSRSRRRIWPKGEESGNIQRVKEVFVDCDADAVLLKVEQI